MYNFRNQVLWIIFLLSVNTIQAQTLSQLMAAQELHQLPTGSDKTELIRKLEREGWYKQDLFVDQNGNPLESPKVDLAPFIDSLGESTFLVTDISPAFPGGTPVLNDYLQSRLGDLLAKPNGEVQNTLFFKFSVLKDGKIVAVEPANPIPEWIPASTVKRCEAAVREMPDWTPGVFKDRPVKVKMLMTFSLQE